MLNVRSACALAWLGCVSGAVAADETATPDLRTVDKSGYHLFNPTPRQFLRELTTDRPDKTEGPYTVDAGHFQLEMDLVNYSRDRETSGGSTVTVEDWAVAPLNLKVGLCNQVDLQLIVETWNEVKATTEAAGGGAAQHQIQRGFGDVALRLKCNLWGDDGGATAFGILPFVKFPTSQNRIGNNAVEGGVIFPLAVNLPAGFDLGLMTEFDVRRDEVGPDYHGEFLNSITLGHDLIGRLGGYVEFFSLVRAEPNFPWTGSIDVGVTYGLTDDIQLDAGINFGVTRIADDLNPFVGLSWRF